MVPLLFHPLFAFPESHIFRIGTAALAAIEVWKQLLVDELV